MESEVQLTLQLKIERDIRNYVITRKWNYTNQKLTEEYTVARDGKLLNNQELSYFENYLRSIIPPDLFEFFLFDGEEVGNIFSTSAYNTYVRNAVFTMCGMDVFEIIRKFTRGYVTKNNSNDDDEVYDTYESAKQQIETLETEKENLDVEVGNLTKELENIDIQLTELATAFKNAGGISRKEKKQLEDEYALAEKVKTETQGVLEAFLAYVTLGNGSWNFDNSAMMVYRVQTWVGKWKKTIIQTVNVFDNQSVDYQDCAIATEMIREIMQGVFTGTKVEGIPTTNLMAKNLKKTVQNSHCTEWNSLVNMLLNNDEKVKDVITQYYNIIQGNLKSSQVFIRATEFNSDVRKVQKAKLLIPDEQILLNDPIPQRREIREIYEKIYTRIPKVAEAEKEKANRLLEQIGMYLDYEDIDDEDIEDLIDKIKLFYETASSSLVNIHGNIQVLDGIKKDAKTISVAFSEVEKGIASTDDLDTLLMFSKDPLSKIERILSTLQAVQKDIEYVARDVEKRRGNIFVDNGGDLSTRYVESRNTIEADSKTVMDWKVM